MRKKHATSHHSPHIASGSSTCFVLVFAKRKGEGDKTVAAALGTLSPPCRLVIMLMWKDGAA
jgi:hypothetical protein